MSIVRFAMQEQRMALEKVSGRDGLTIIQFTSRSIANLDLDLAQAQLVMTP
jgi:hypothetical protein